MMRRTKPQRVVDRYKKMQIEKAPWLPLYQLLGEYVMTRKQDFTADMTPGQFLTDKIFDSTAGSAYRLMASAVIGALWPNGSKTFQIEIPTALKGTEFEDAETKEFYERASKVMAEKMDNPRAGLLTSLEEYMGDQCVFGISGIAAFETEDLDVPVQFTAVDVKKIAVDEGRDGFVDTVYIEKELTLRQMIQEYGYESLSRPNQEKWDKGMCDEKVKVLHAIEPRMERDPYSYGAANMPVASIHIELATQKVLKESGFTEMPVFVSRFWKAMNEKYGRSPAMEGLPDILEINAIREASIIAIEKSLDPPLAVFDDGTLGGGVIDTSAGAINTFSVSGRLGSAGSKPVEPLVTVGELNSTYARITELTENIRNHFMIDRLMDFNNEQRMTAYETSVRDNLRGQTLGSTFSRQIAEVFLPLIERVFNILLRKGLFGVVRGSVEERMILEEGGMPTYIPDKVADLMLDGKDVYKVTFISPAARIMQTEELMGIERTVNFAVTVAGVQPEVLDNLDTDEIMRSVQTLTGAPSRIIRDLDTVRKIRQARAEAQARAEELAAQREESEAMRNVAQAGQMAGLTGDDQQAA
jgi:hypothetical protein